MYDNKFQLEAEVPQLDHLDYDEERPLIDDEELLRKLRGIEIVKPNGEQDVHLPGQTVPDYMKPLLESMLAVDPKDRPIDLLEAVSILT